MSVLKVQLAVLRCAQIKMVATRVLVVLAIAWLLMHMDVKVNTYIHTAYLLISVTVIPIINAI